MASLAQSQKRNPPELCQRCGPGGHRVQKWGISQRSSRKAARPCVKGENKRGTIHTREQGGKKSIANVGGHGTEKGTGTEAGGNGDEENVKEGWEENLSQDRPGKIKSQLWSALNA